ncbi:MAG: Diguanylate cyclase DosC [Betaproteobacteria bacterium ADurb.Bin341]|nr:MAG: Diguanylate cyclase DosC [Betaproteobacteria bacterium ADurb.Bin341]
MAKLKNPSEIARETLKQLAGRRMLPTPSNYRTLYQEISGTQEEEAFPEKHLSSLAAAIPKATPEQLRLARELEAAVKASSWESYRAHLIDFISNIATSQKLAWAELINELLKQWEAKHSGITPARKREALDRVLGNTSAAPEVLYNRLQNIVRNWAQGREADMALEGAMPASGATTISTEATSETPQATATASAHTTNRDGELLRELRELFAYTLETAFAGQLAETPQLASDAKALADEIRKASNQKELEEFLTHLKRFAFRLELLSEDQAELRKSLLDLLRLLVENMSELVLDDQWLHGQIEVVRNIIDKPLSQHAIDDAERRLKEVLFKQSQLKQSLHEAREAIKSMLAGFVDHLADFADATSGYHDKIEASAEKISVAKDINELETVLAEVMRETRNIQINAQRSRDELRATQQQVAEKEARIHELEHELEQTSTLVRHDQLTGALNRRGLDDMFEKEKARSERHQTTLCVALLDLDNFKKLNDSLGHEAGDQALIHLANVCRETLRPQDTIARYGGEEFIIILPETGLDAAAAALTRLQRELTKRIFLHEHEKVLITFSAGVTELRPEDSQATVVKRADEAMYKAKQSGKNRVEKG